MTDAELLDAQLPEPVRTYLSAHGRHDTDAALATFAPDATVVDEDRTHRGADEIRSWLDTAARQFTFTRTLTGVDDEGDGRLVVTNHLEGDFPGGVVDLRHRFALVDGRIVELVIAP